ncbi:hypothetical protein LRE75_34350 [Streptomyces sp. 372A]
MSETGATWASETKSQGVVQEPGPLAPRLYSLTTRYTDQFLGGQVGPDLLCDDAIAALHFALTVSSSSPLAVTCNATADGRTWTRLPLQALRRDAENALRQDAKNPMYPVPLDPRTDPTRPRAALSRLIETTQATWLDSVLRQPVDEAAAWVPDEPDTRDWIRAGQVWAAVWGELPSDAVLDHLPTPVGTPSTTAGRTLLRAEAAAVLNAIALAHTRTTDDSLTDLHAAWKLLHIVDEWVLDPQYVPGTDLRTPIHLLLDRISALHPDTAAHLAATRDHPNAARIRAATHDYLRYVLPLWPGTADWTHRARTAYLEELHTLRSDADDSPPSPSETQAQKVLRSVLASLAKPAQQSHHEAATLWRSHSGRGAEQASWDSTGQSNRMDDLARAHATEGTPRQKGEAIAAAQGDLTAATNYHGKNLTIHAARGHLHRLAASLVTLDKAQRTLQLGIWDIAAARRAQHDSAQGPWNGYDERRATADLTPALTTGEAHIEQLRRRHIATTHEALTDLIPQLADMATDDYRHHLMRGHLAPLDLLIRDLNELGALIDTRRRACTEIRNSLQARPSFGRRATTSHDLATAEERLRSLEQRYANTQTEFALSVTLGRTFDRVRQPPDADQRSAGTASGPPRRTGRTAPSTPTGHDQATNAALRPSPTGHGRC